MRTLLTILLLACFGICDQLTVTAQRADTIVYAPQSIQSTKPDSIEISAYDNKIVVKNAPVGSKLEIYSVVGIRVKEIKMKQPAGEYTVDIAKGYYIVRIGETVRKIAIR